MVDTRFARMFIRTGGPVLLRQFGDVEPLVYYPRSGSSRDINAIVERGTLEVITETGDITSQAIVIRVLNTATGGITSDEVDTGGDEIKVALRIGLTPERRALVRVLDDSGGMIRVLCQ